MLKKIRNPIPLYSYTSFEKKLRFGNDSASAAFDMQRGTWLPPYGNGIQADFHVRYSGIGTNGDWRTSLVFNPGDGAYIVSDTAGSHPLVYNADTNGMYASEYSFSTNSFLLDSKGALIIRSRTELDAKGNPVRANYSKIYGPLEIGKIFKFSQMVFNPVVNSTNLEFDVRNNLSRNSCGRFHP